MPEIRQTLSFLTISNRILERNFTYKVINSMNSLFKVAHITIKKNYFLANQIPVAKGDTISLSLQNNNEDKVTIFSGVIFDISTTNSEIQLKAEFRIVDNTIFNETYQDCTLEYALQKLLPSDKLKYEAQEVKGDQFILQGKKESSIRGLLKNHSYCLDRENCLVVFDKPKTRNNYIIDNCIKDIKGNQITIFPIPQLDLLDTVEYSNGIGELKKQKYLVRGLRVVGDYINMILDVAPYQEEIVKQNPPQEEAPLPASKPVKELFAPSITQAGRGETADSLLNQLHTDAKTHIRKLAEEVRNEMGDSFETIVITSIHRTVASQVDILSKKMRLLSGTKNMFLYYEEQISEKVNGVTIVGKSSSLNYLNALQAYFDGTVLETLDIKRWKKIRLTHQEEIVAMGTKSNKNEDKIEVINNQGEKERKTPRTLEAEELLTKYMDITHKEYGFRPSTHMFPKGTVYVIDISIDGINREKTADRLFAKNKTYYPDSCANTLEGQKCEAGYKTKTKGEPHIHLKLLKNYTPKN